MTATFKQPLSILQLELLEMFSRHQVSTEDVIAIKKMLSDFFAQKAMDEADQLWEQRQYTQTTMDNWLNTHQRTPYKK